MRWAILIFTLIAAAPASARARLACLDSYGTVIEGITKPAECKKLGARWGKPGTRSVPKDERPRDAKRGGHRRSHRR